MLPLLLRVLVLLATDGAEQPYRCVPARSPACHYWSERGWEVDPDELAHAHIRTHHGRGTSNMSKLFTSLFCLSLIWVMVSLAMSWSRSVCSHPTLLLVTFCLLPSYAVARACSWVGPGGRGGCGCAAVPAAGLPSVGCSSSFAPIALSISCWLVYCYPLFAHLTQLRIRFTCSWIIEMWVIEMCAEGCRSWSNSRSCSTAACATICDTAGSRPLT
jgi:hypothetical protein